ncbi:hypothetical protein HADU_04870 [Acinetobacter sp. HA]|nr:hypothetical protein HADU_04870 [Acinetobacter sp. HA]
MCDANFRRSQCKDQDDLIIGQIEMLFKIEDGFYLNTQHIIAVRVIKDSTRGVFELHLEYTPNSVRKSGEYIKVFSSQLEAEMFLNQLNQKIR